MRRHRDYNSQKHHNRHKGRHRYHNRPKPRYSLFQKLSYFSNKHPVAIGVILIICSIVLFRLSFTNAFLSSKEVFMWSILISVGLFLGGLFSLIAYWRNHVSMLTTRHNINWRNR